MASNEKQKEIEYQEGEIVVHQGDTYRVRRNNGDTLQLVNWTGYRIAPTSEVKDNNR